MKKLKWSVLLCVLLAGVGCSSTPSGPAFNGVESVGDEQGTVYLYRPERFFLTAETFDVVVDDTVMARLGNKGFYRLALPSGVYSIHSDSSVVDKEKEFRIEAGDVMFLRLELERKPALCYCSRLWFESIDRQEALDDLDGLRRHEALAQSGG